MARFHLVNRYLSMVARCHIQTRYHKDRYMLTSCHKVIFIHQDKCLPRFILDKCHLRCTLDKHRPKLSLDKLHPRFLLRFSLDRLHLSMYKYQYNPSKDKM
jgi:hypothetical protein